jgi:exopolysaccharide production protein ExoQ
MSAGCIVRPHTPTRQLTPALIVPEEHSGEQQPPVWQQLITWALFWPLLCLIARQAPYFAGPARDAVFYKGQSLSSGPDYHPYLYINMAIQAAFAIAAPRKIWAVLKYNPLILGCLGLIFLSALWSEAPGNALRMGIEVSLCTFFASYLFVRFSTEQLMRLMIFMGAASALTSIVFAFALPSYGIFAGYAGGAWKGICDHKNTLGISMAYLLTPMFFAANYRRWQRLLYAALMLFLIAMSHSIGAWAYTAGVLFFVALLHVIRRLARHESLLALILVTFIVAAVGVLAFRSLDTIAPMFGKDGSMSGRTEIYRQVWQSIMKAPLLGYGYAGFWNVNQEAHSIRVNEWTNIGYAENGVLDLALQLGLLGAALVLFMLGRAAVQGVRLLLSPSYSPQIGWFVTILFLAALTNIDAGWLLVPDKLDWVLILIACVGLERETQRARAPLESPALSIVDDEIISNFAAAEL